MPRRRHFLIAAAAATPLVGRAAAALTLAAASDLRVALDEVLVGFRAEHPGARIDVVYGASGKLSTQIRNGAPFDVFLSADIEFAQALVEQGHAARRPTA
jgi:molybdate transport system substrate-binding protein